MKYIFLILFSLTFVYGQKTIVYDKENNLVFDIYYPDNYKKSSAHNLYVWVHGGGFSGGSRNDVDEVKRMKDAQMRGFVAISISYRLLANSNLGFGCDLPKQEKVSIFKNAAYDILKALIFMQKNQKSLELQINKVILGGSSAGAETILNAHYLRDLWFGSEFKEVKIDGLISYAGAIVDDRYITKENIIPTVFVHGLMDDVVPAYDAPHRNCNTNQAGYVPLVGDALLQSINQKFQTPSYSIFSKSGKHEWSAFKPEYLDQIFSFIDNSILKSFNQSTLIYVE